MEVCTSHCTLSTPQLPLSFNHISSFKTPHFRFPSNHLSPFPGVICHRRKSIRAALDESSGFTEEKKSDEVATFEDDVNDVRFDTAAPVNVNVGSNQDTDGVFSETIQSQVKVHDDDENDFSSVSSDDTLQPLKELLKNLNIELDVEDTPTILLYGGSALIAVWLLSAIVGAIDSIPVFPKLLEVVGLGYSVWFTTRYLLFKKNREELGSKIEELKQEIFGSSDK